VHPFAVAQCAPQVIDLAVLGRAVSYDVAKIEKFARRFVETSRDGLAELDAALTRADLAYIGRPEFRANGWNRLRAATLRHAGGSPAHPVKLFIERTG
jgi:hypothetical protein